MKLYDFLKYNRTTIFQITRNKFSNLRYNKDISKIIYDGGLSLEILNCVLPAMYTRFYRFYRSINTSREISRPNLQDYNLFSLVQKRSQFPHVFTFACFIKKRILCFIVSSSSAVIIITIIHVFWMIVLSKIISIHYQ